MDFCHTWTSLLVCQPIMGIAYNLSDVLLFITFTTSQCELFSALLCWSFACTLDGQAIFVTESGHNIFKP